MRGLFERGFGMLLLNISVANNVNKMMVLGEGKDIPFLSILSHVYFLNQCWLYYKVLGLNVK